MIIQTIRMKSVTAEGMGTLSVFEAEHDVPFAIKRIYYIHNVPAGVQRGGHAHKKLRQLLWCPYGKILIKLRYWRPFILYVKLKRLKLCWTAPTKA